MEKLRRIDCEYREIDSLSKALLKSSSPSKSLPVSATAVAIVVNYILHPVSKFDTLAGVAIKYGIAVADIKKLNGLVTDLQMFALETLKIPLPEWHPSSAILSNDHHVTSPRPSSSEHTPPTLRRSSDWKVSPATTSLQGFYSLRQSEQEPAAEGLKWPVYQNGGVAHDQEGEQSYAFSSLPKPPLHHPRKSKSVAHGLKSVNPDLLDPLLTHETEYGSPDKFVDKFLRSRQKSESNLTSLPWEKLLKEKNNCSSSNSVITGKRLALLPKSAGQTFSGMDSSESLPTDDFHGVQKSSSTLNLQDFETRFSGSFFCNRTNVGWPKN